MTLYLDGIETQIAPSVINERLSGSLDWRSNLGGELVTNGSFTGAATGWTLGAGWTYNANAVDRDGAGTAAMTQDTLVPVAGSIYKVVYTISAYTDGSVTVSLGGTSGTARSSAATFTEYIKAADATVLTFTPSADSTFTIDNVSVKKVGSVAADGISMWIDDRGAAAGKAALHMVTEDGTGHVFGDRVGIGTLYPAYPLDIVGQTSITGGVAAGTLLLNQTSKTAADEKVLSLRYEGTEYAYFKWHNVDSMMSLNFTDTLGELENIRSVDGGATAALEFSSSFGQIVFSYRHSALIYVGAVAAATAGATLKDANPIIWYPEYWDGNASTVYPMQIVAEMSSTGPTGAFLWKIGSTEIMRLLSTGTLQLSITGMGLQAAKSDGSTLLFIAQNAAGQTQTVAQITGNAIVANSTFDIAKGQLTGDLLLNANGTLNLGNSTNKFNQLYARGWTGGNGQTVDSYQEGPFRFSTGIKIGGTAGRSVTDATSQLELFNGTAPSGTLANGFTLYSSGGQPFIMDAAGAGHRVLTAKTVLGTIGSLTIASGAIAVTQTYHKVVVEGGTGTGADALTSATGGVEGQLLILSPATSGANDTVTVTNGTGAGAFILAGGADFVMDHVDDRIIFIHNGTEWVEIARSNNS